MLASRGRPTPSPSGLNAPLPALLICLSMIVTPAPAAEPPRDWSGVELAWRNDPRAVSDASLPVEPPPSRRPSRRTQRRSMRRVPQEVSPGPRREPAGEPRVERGPVTTASIGLDPEGMIVPPAAPADVDRSVVVHRDQAYGSDGHARQRLDLYLPDGCAGGGLPLVVWIHGPDWRNGSKADCPVAWLAGEGYAVASVGYRTSDEAIHPAQLDDCRAAIASLVADADTWGIDPARICAAGHAAGGHLAALVGFAPSARGTVREASAEDGDPPAAAPAAVAVIGAPVHLTTLGAESDRSGSPASRLVGGPLQEVREAAQRASPLVHVSADDPPTLILHGGRDTTVRVDQAVVLDKTLATAGVDSTLVILDEATRPALERGSPAGTALLEFLDRVIGPGTARAPRD